MRRKDKEIADPAAVEGVLRSAQFCRIAMCDGGEPYVIPVCFGYENGALYFHCANEGRKLDILRTNPRVCFEADEDAGVVTGASACACTVRYRSVVGVGRAVILSDPREKRKGLAALTRRYTDAPREFAEEALARTTVVRIDVESMTGKQSGF